MSKYYIYKIYSKKNPSQFYIGSTNNISVRKSKHKKNTTNKRSKNYWNFLYQYIRANGGWIEFEMTEIDNFIANTNDERLSKEQDYIILLNPSLNSIFSKKQ
jgi:hypothetical protein